MPWLEDRLQEIVAAIMRGAAGVKLGPGVLRTIIPIVGIGVVAIAGVTYALAGNPLIALAAFVIGILFLAYVVERSFRYAENNPLPALLGGGELLQLFRDQRSARDKNVVVEGNPVVGASANAIEDKSGGNV
jgi:hypothetical protein